MSAIIANEMLQDPAILMTSKNPSLSGSRSRPRYNAGQQSHKSTTPLVDNAANVLISQLLNASSQTTRSNRSRRSPRKKKVKTPAKEDQTELAEQATQTPVVITDVGQENRSPPKRRRNFRSSKSSSKQQQETASPTTPKPVQYKGGRNRNPLEISTNLQVQTLQQRVPHFKPATVNLSGTPYRRLPLALYGYQQNRYLSELNPFARSFIPSIRKPGFSNEYVSRQIVEYYHRNRQTNDQFKWKQTIRQSLENILRNGFPQHFVNLYMVGSSTNGIGDNGSSVDICIIARHKPTVSQSHLSPVAASKEVEAVTTSSTTSEVELEVQSSAEEVLSSVTEAESTSASTVEENPAAEPENDEANSEIAQEASEPLSKDPEEKSEDGEVKEAEVAEPLVETTSETVEEKAGEIGQEVAPNEVEEVQEPTTAIALPASEVAATELTLTMVENVLRSKNFAKEIVSIPAKVPIIKFKTECGQLNITLNLNQEVSIRNSQLIRDYSKLDWRFPYLAMMLKQWAKENRINNAMEKTISNYSWTLMTVHYLQVGVEPPVLPSLQKVSPRRYNHASIEQSIHNWHRYRAKWTTSNTMTLRQLLKGMFRYYGYVFAYDQHVISVREGKVLERTGAFASNEETHSQWNSFLCIEEPFTRTNTARSTHDKEKFNRIVEVFRIAANALRGVRTSLFEVIADDINYPITY